MGRTKKYAADPNAPKRPLSAYFLFAGDVRDSVVDSISGDFNIGKVGKKIGQMWKNLSNAKKAPYQKKYEEAKAKFDTDMAAYLEAGGEKASPKRKRKEMDGKKKKDTNAPKKPVGGAYGIFLAENREAIVKSLPEGHKITDVTKAAGEQWKGLSDEAKKPFQEKYEKKTEEFKAAMVEYEKTLPAEEEKEEPVSPPTKKAKVAKPVKEASPPKATKSKKPAKPQAPVIDADVLKKAEKLNLDSALKNLMARPDVMAKDFPHAKLLSALEKSDGLVNKAKYTLMEA